MILKRKNMSENKWNHFKIVPLLTQSLSTVNCQFGEAAKFQFAGQLSEPDKHVMAYLISHIVYLSTRPFPEKDSA